MLARNTIYHNLTQPNYGKFVGREAELARITALLRPYPHSIDHRIVIDGIGGIGKSSLALEVAYRSLYASQGNIADAQEQTTTLRRILEQRFSDEELRTLCFDMALDYDMLPGQGKGGKSRELIAYLDRRNRLPEVVELLQRTRPDIEEINDFSKQLAEIDLGNRFDAIIWTSAKRTVLTGEGIMTRHQTTTTLQDVFRDIAKTLNRDDILKAHLEEQAHIVRQALIQQRTLLILDNLETIDDEQVMAFLQEIPAPTKVIVTTRHRISTAVPVRLVGMSLEEAITLINEECARRSVVLPEEDAERLYKRTGGLPLAIIWSIAQMGFGYGIENVLTRIGQPTNDVVRFCFEGTMDRLRNRPAYHLLLAGAMFTNYVSREGLGYATNISLLDRDEGLVELERLSLVNKSGNRFSQLPLTRLFALSELEREPDFAQQAKARWIVYLQKLFIEPQNEYYWRSSDFGFYEDGENILEAVEWAYQAEKAEEVFHLSIEGFYYLEFIGDWNRLLSLLQNALDLAEAVGNKQYVARLANILGTIVSQQDKYEEALALYETSLNAYQERISLRGAALTLQNQSAVYRKLSQFDQAEKLLAEAMQIANVLEDGDLKVLFEANYGKLERDRGNWELAWEHFINVRDYFEHRTEEWPRDEFLARSIWGQLAIVAIHLNQPAQAKAFCLRSIEYFEVGGAKGTLSTLKYRLALAEQALGEYEAAAQHLQEALTWFERLEMKKDYAEARQTEQELRQQLAG